MLTMFTMLLGNYNVYMYVDECLCFMLFLYIQFKVSSEEQHDSLKGQLQSVQDQAHKQLQEVSNELQKKVILEIHS